RRSCSRTYIRCSRRHGLVKRAGERGIRGNPGPALVRITNVKLVKPLFGRDRPADLGRGLVSGLLSGAIGVCVAFLVAGLTGSVGSPVAAVAGAMVDLSPQGLKEFAIREFGSNDKLVVQIGVGVVLAPFAA